MRLAGVWAEHPWYECGPQGRGGIAHDDRDADGAFAERGRLLAAEIPGAGYVSLPSVRPDGTLWPRNLLPAI